MLTRRGQALPCLASTPFRACHYPHLIKRRLKEPNSGNRAGFAQKPRRGGLFIDRPAYLLLVFCFSAARDLAVDGWAHHLRAAEKQKTPNRGECCCYYKQATPTGFPPDSNTLIPPRSSPGIPEAPKEFKAFKEKRLTSLYRFEFFGRFLGGGHQTVRPGHKSTPRPERAKLKSRRDDLIIAQGKRGTSATLGMSRSEIHPSPPTAEERGRGKEAVAVHNTDGLQDATSMIAATDCVCHRQKAGAGYFTCAGRRPRECPPLGVRYCTP
jgi:hypothetical protein